MPVATCPACRQTFGYFDTNPGAMIACVCGQAFDPTGAQQGVVNVSPRQTVSPPSSPPARPRSPIIDFGTYQPERSNLNLMLALLVGASVVICGVFLLVMTKRHTPTDAGKQELVTNSPMKATLPVDEPISPFVAKPKPEPVTTMPDAVFDPPLPVVSPRPVATDPYADLEKLLAKKIDGLIWSERATDAPGRSIRDGNLKAVIVFASSRPAESEAFEKRESKKGWSSFHWRQFVFVGEKPLIDRIRTALPGKESD